MSSPLQNAANATSKIALKTGQNTGTLGIPGTGFSAWPLLGWLAAIGFIAFVIYRMRRTGQRVNLRGLSNPRVVAGLIVLVGVFLIARWAVAKYTKPGHMSVLEAQAMDMTVKAS